MTDLIDSWRQTVRAVRLDPGHDPHLVEVEPLEIFSVFGRPADSIVRHLNLGADAIMGTDVHTSGAFAVPTASYPKNDAATRLLALTGTVVEGFAIVGSVIILGTDADGRITDTPPHIEESLRRLGYRVSSEVRNAP
ncbi:hypothetical protein [Clavibacter michiganensis]|uniref:hypothetical protein n=1 Tax=Clavibacter michiganensis TaxID=28447 RepID=UPI00292F7C44|nr:hypothetical protein [Clavibacter michiganensis]